MSINPLMAPFLDVASDPLAAVPAVPAAPAPAPAPLVEPTKAGILDSDDFSVDQVDTPEWKRSPVTYLRTLTGTERDAYEDEMYKIRGKEVVVNRQNARAKLLVKCICDARGNRLFSDDDVAKLGAKSAKVLDRLFAMAQKLNGLTAADLKDLVGNSGAGRSA